MVEADVVSGVVGGVVGTVVGERVVGKGVVVPMKDNSKKSQRIINKAR